MVMEFVRQFKDTRMAFERVFYEARKERLSCASSKVAQGAEAG